MFAADFNRLLQQNLQVADIAASKGAKFILDTSGEALRKAAGRGLHLIKPSLGELEELIGRELPEAADQEQAVRALIDGGAAEMVALTLGRDGALLGTRAGLCRLHGVKVKTRSAVGAGDSFLAGMTLGLAQGRDPEDAFVLAVAAGTAAVMTAGTELCRRAEVERLYRTIRGQSSPAAPAHQ